MEAPRSIPEELYKDFTLNGQMSVGECYIDDSLSNKGKIYTSELIQFELDRVSRVLAGEESFSTLSWLIEAFKKYPILDEDTLVIGSQSPLYEACCLKFGGYPIIVEFEQIICEDPLIRGITVKNFEKSNQHYTRAISISTHEHTGLGRYGDELDPYGDIKAISKLREKITPGGLLYLSVPRGHDRLIWNAHRIYGPKRFPLLIEGWDWIDSFGYDPEGKLPNEDEWYQPIFVLRNPE